MLEAARATQELVQSSTFQRVAAETNESMRRIAESIGRLARPDQVARELQELDADRLPTFTRDEIDPAIDTSPPIEAFRRPEVTLLEGVNAQLRTLADLLTEGAMHARLNFETTEATKAIAASTSADIKRLADVTEQVSAPAPA